MKKLTDRELSLPQRKVHGIKTCYHMTRAVLRAISLENHKKKGPV